MSLASFPSATSPPHAETPPALAPKRAKSPPMAFERTSNDALAPRISPPFQNIDPFTSASSHIMSPNGSAYTGSPDLQALVHKQANAIQQLHLAFAAEREAWQYERENLYQRISSLEKLLVTNSGHRCVQFLCFLQVIPDSIDKTLAQQNLPLCRRTMVAAALPHRRPPA